MDEINQIKQIIISKLEEIEKLKKKVEKSLKKAPQGSLILSRSNGVIQYYHKTESAQKKGKYIEKKNSKLITALAQKDYDVAFYKEMEKQEGKLQKILKNLPNKDLAEIFLNLPNGRKQFVSPYVLPDEEYIKQWLAVEYTGKIYKDEFLRYTTERGEKVRSKSEKIIADKLYKMGIPYRYEYPVYLKGYGTVYPDFMILKVSTREEAYIEHFGMMDQPEYFEKAFLKINEFARNGIVLGKNLYLTFETQSVPLNINFVEKILKELL